MNRAQRPVPKYTPLLLALAETMPRQHGRVQHVTVLHDDRCSLLASTGPCDCEPELAPLEGAS